MTRPLRQAALFTAFAFLLNALLPFFAVYNVEALPASAKEMSSLFGEKVLICTGDGFKWVAWADIESGKEKHNPDSHYKCPLCYVAAHGLKQLAAKVVIALLPAHEHVPMLARHDARPIPIFVSSTRQSRAPPASFHA